MYPHKNFTSVRKKTEFLSESSKTIDMLSVFFEPKWIPNGIPIYQFSNIVFYVRDDDSSHLSILKVSLALSWFDDWDMESEASDEIVVWLSEWRRPGGGGGKYCFQSITKEKNKTDGNQWDLWNKKKPDQLLADNTRGLKTTKQKKPRPVVSAASHPITSA